jgi:predicted metal-dependent phosphotriesterase family hydrolase
MIRRRTFLQRAAALAAGCALPDSVWSHQQAFVMTVTGPVNPTQLKLTLSHEHIVVDFIGAERVSKDRYEQDEVFNTALPFLEDVKKRGCNTFVDCTPAYIGRDVELLKKLSAETGLYILTTTGYYGAAQEKFIPRHAYSKSAEQLAARWIDEWRRGIEGTGIKPGLIKTGVDKAPLSEVQTKLIDAAALTHLACGLPIAVHTGNGAAAETQLEILALRKVSPSARIWVHAQNEKDQSYHIRAAQRGSWVSFDGVRKESIRENVNFLQTMKKEGLLNAVLCSQDSGWYNVGDPGGGKFNDYNAIFTDFIPALRASGFTTQEIDTVFIANPAKAFTIGVRKIS